MKLYDKNRKQAWRLWKLRGQAKGLYTDQAYDDFTKALDDNFEVYVYQLGRDL
jgi:hypothetical protein